MLHFRSIVFFLTLLVLALGVPKDAFQTLVTYEAKQRVAAGVADNQYRLLPFRLTGDHQHFIRAPVSNESLRVEVVVHWIDRNSSLVFPGFDLGQKVRLVIEEETLSAAPARPILTREFLTQTGFKINLMGGKRYRWRVESSGKQSKIVEIALNSQSYPDNTSAIFTPKDHSVEVGLLKEMSDTLERVKQMRWRREEKPKQNQVSKIWAWMSGVEMLSLLALVLVQLALFEKVMMPASVV